MEKAERYIIENLAKPDLTPKLIAEHIGVSLRHLYRLFLQENLSINKYIQLKRLEKVKADLLDKRNKQSSITQVALKWGFWDGAHFQKSLKRPMVSLLKNLERVCQFKFSSLNVIFRQIRRHS